MLVVLVALLPACNDSSAPAPDAVLIVDQIGVTLELKNLPEEISLHGQQPWHEGLKLHHVNAQGQLAPAVTGSYHVEGNRVEFRPAFPLLPGQEYICHFKPAAIGNLAGLLAAQDTLFRTEKRLSQQASPQVIAIYPSGDFLPANHLKFYIEFSAPMQQGEIFGFFSLLDKTTGRSVPRPFRHTELWSPDECRLTLWFHPGRQKTGVNLNVDLGAILQEGHDYELQINPQWRSRAGVPLADKVRKSFQAGPSDHLQPNPETWQLKIPSAGSRTPFQCDAGEPLDWALAQRVLEIQGPPPENTPLRGEIQLLANERRWQFTPNQPWQPGRYRLAIQGSLEDLAGNSVARPFEVDLSHPQDSPEQRVHYLDFSLPGHQKNTAQKNTAQENGHE